MRRIAVFLALCTLVAVFIFTNQEDDPPGKKVTPTEAACEMLRDGDTAVEAFDILVGQGLSDLAASRAVNRALGQGCG